MIIRSGVGGGGFGRRGLRERFGSLGRRVGKLEVLRDSGRWRGKIGFGRVVGENGERWRFERRGSRKLRIRMLGFETLVRIH